MLVAPEALIPWFARASIFVLPARYEPFGLSALEAALAGCALVLGDIPSLREIWRDAALFVAPDDAGALAEALQALIRDPARRSDLAARAHARGLLYSPRRMAEGYLAAYHDLLRRRQSPRGAHRSCRGARFHREASGNRGLVPPGCRAQYDCRR